MLPVKETSSLNRFQDHFIEYYTYEVKNLITIESMPLYNFSAMQSMPLNDFSLDKVLEVFKRHFKSNDISSDLRFNNEVESLIPSNLLAKITTLTKVYFELKSFAENIWYRDESFAAEELQFMFSGSEKDIQEFFNVYEVMTFYKSFFYENISKEKLFEMTKQIRLTWKDSRNKLLSLNGETPIHHRLKWYTVKDLLISNLTFTKRNFKKLTEPKIKVVPRITYNPFLLKPMTWPSTSEKPINDTQKTEPYTSFIPTQVDLSSPLFQEFRDPTTKEKPKTEPIKNNDDLGNKPKFQIPQIPKSPHDLQKSQNFSAHGKPIDSFEFSFDDNETQEFTPSKEDIKEYREMIAQIKQLSLTGPF